MLLREEVDILEHLSRRARDGRTPERARICGQLGRARAAAYSNQAMQGRELCEVPVGIRASVPARTKLGCRRL
jgi:hypothetical protein